MTDLRRTCHDKSRRARTHDRCDEKSVIFDLNICHGPNGTKMLHRGADAPLKPVIALHADASTPSPYDPSHAIPPPTASRNSALRIAFSMRRQTPTHASPTQQYPCLISPTPRAPLRHPFSSAVINVHLRLKLFRPRALPRGTS